MSSGYVSRIDLRGHAVVVLGAGAGMGAESCRALAEAGAALICVDRDPDLAAAIARETSGIAVAEDVTSRKGMIRVFSDATDAFGSRVRGVVDVVGIATLGAIESFDDEALRAQMDIVLRHAILAVQIGAPLLAGNGGGAMTFIGSNSGMKSVPGQAIFG